MSENDPIQISSMSFGDKPTSFAEVTPEVDTDSVPEQDTKGDDLEEAWQAEHPHRDERDADFEAILNAHHKAEDHAVGDRQHHGHWGPHHH